LVALHELTGVDEARLHGVAAASIEEQQGDEHDRGYHRA
jgi:hypothetical protein